MQSMPGLVDKHCYVCRKRLRTAAALLGEEGVGSVMSVSSQTAASVTAVRT